MHWQIFIVNHNITYILNRPTMKAEMEIW